MKKALLMPLLILAALALVGCGSTAEKLNNEGNEAFAQEDYEGALLAYNQAQGESPELAEPHYNAASAHYKKEAYDQAQQEIEGALLAEQHQDGLDQNSYYNLGNTFFQAEQYQAAVEAYKEALRLDPADLQAKQNLELALRQLQQQQQEQQNQSQQDEESEGQQQQDQQEQDGQDQDQQDQQSQVQQDQQQDAHSQDGQPDQEQVDQQNGQPQQITGLTEEQARQLLEAAAEGTESLEEFLQQILVVSGLPPAEDW
jgi:Ca-activated chloride channel family protein